MKSQKLKNFFHYYIDFSTKKSDLGKHFESFFAPPKPPCSNFATQLSLLHLTLLISAPKPAGSPNHQTTAPVKLLTCHCPRSGSRPGQSRALDARNESPLGARLPASPGKWKNDKSSGISPAAETSHLFYTSHVSSQCQTRVKLTLGFFVLLSLIALGVRLGCLFEMFLVSWGRIVLLWNSLLELPLLHPIVFGSSCFHCRLFLDIFLFPLWFLQWSLGCLVVYCLASICFYFFYRFFLVIGI